MMPSLLMRLSVWTSVTGSCPFLTAALICCWGSFIISQSQLSFMTILLFGHMIIQDHSGWHNSFRLPVAGSMVDHPWFKQGLTPSNSSPLKSGRAQSCSSMTTPSSTGSMGGMSSRTRMIGWNTRFMKNAPSNKLNLAFSQDKNWKTVSITNSETIFL